MAVAKHPTVVGPLGLLGLELDVGVAARRRTWDGGCSDGAPWGCRPRSPLPDETSTFCGNHEVSAGRPMGPIGPGRSSGRDRWLILLEALSVDKAYASVFVSNRRIA